MIEPAPEPTDVEPVAAEVAPPPVAEKTPRKREAAVVAVDRPAPDPEPVQAPAAAVASSPPVADLARVEVDRGGTSVVVELVRDGQRWALPASVEPGNYDIVYAFPGSKSVALGTARLLERDARTVKCSATLHTCTKSW